MNHIPYKSRSLLSALRGLLHWADIHILRSNYFEAYIPETKITYSVPSNTIFSWYLSKYGSYEAENTNVLIDLLEGKLDSVFVDVGANFGWYTCILSKLAGESGAVYAIEPDADNIDLLNRNIAKNELNNVIVFPYGVSNVESELRLHKAPITNPGMHSFVTKSHTPARTDDQLVKVKTLDQLLADVPGRITLMKMDIEGFEVNALQGAKKTLERCDSLLIEYSPGFLKAGGQSPADFFKYIVSAGLQIHTLENKKLRLLNINEIAKLTNAGESDYYWQQDLICTRTLTV